MRIMYATYVTWTLNSELVLCSTGCRTFVTTIVKYAMNISRMDLSWKLILRMRITSVKSAAK